MGKTKSKIKKKKRRLEQKAIQNGTANSKLLKKGEKQNGLDTNYHKILLFLDMANYLVRNLMKQLILLMNGFQRQQLEWKFIS